MKTAVSIPDEVFKEAERLARRLSKSRSKLYGEAVAEYCARHDPDAITRAMDRVATQIQKQPDEFTTTATQRVLRRIEW